MLLPSRLQNYQEGRRRGGRRPQLGEWQAEGADGDQPDTGQVSLSTHFCLTVELKTNILIWYCRVYTIMGENKQAFGDTSFEDVKAQMELYKA